MRISTRPLDVVCRDTSSSVGGGGDLLKIIQQLTLTVRGSCRRQILTTKVDPRTVRVKIFLMAVDP